MSAQTGETALAIAERWLRTIAANPYAECPHAEWADEALGDVAAAKAMPAVPAVPSLADAPRFAVAELDSPDGHWEWVCLPGYDGDRTPWVKVFGFDAGSRYGVGAMEDLGARITFTPLPVRAHTTGGDQ